MRESPYLHQGRKHGTHAYCYSPEPTPERVNLEGFKCLTELASKSKGNLVNGVKSTAMR